MTRQVFPTYSICSLAGTVTSDSDIIVDGFAHYLATHGDLHFPHKHSFYHLVFFTTGSGRHSIDFVNFDVVPGQVYFMIPGQVHTWDFDSAPDGFIINFSETYINELITNPRYLKQFVFFSGIADKQVILLSAKEQARLLLLFETMLSESRTDHLLKDDLIRTSLLQLFIYVNRYATKDSVSGYTHHHSSLLQNFETLIDGAFKENKLPKEYAALLHVTPNHLNAVCKEVTGSSAGELIRSRILLEAKRLLVNAQVSIAEIASVLHFTDNSYFSRFFKKYEGMSPEMFRKQNCTH